MKLQELQNRISIEENKAIIAIVQQNIRRKKRFKTIGKYLLYFSLVILCCASIYFPLKANKYVFIDTSLESCTDLNKIKRPGFVSYTIESAFFEIKDHDFKEAKEILLYLPKSENRDWLLALSYVGLNKFDQAEHTFREIKRNQNHQYNSNLTDQFCLKFYTLKLKQFYVRWLE